MGNQNSPPKRTLQQEDLHFLGERCPFGDAELAYLYRAYHYILKQKRASFLQDWAVACLLQQQQLLQKQQQEADDEQLQALLEEHKTLLQIVQEKILPPRFGNGLYQASFLAQGDVSMYSEAALDNDESSLENDSDNNEKPSQQSPVDEFTRKARLEQFFQGISDSSRRGSKAALTVLFETCCLLDDSVSSDDSSPRRIQALDFIDTGYRLTLATEFLREAGNGGDDMGEYLAPDDTTSDPTLVAFANSLVERRKSRQQRRGIFEKADDNNGQKGWVELDDILEWSEAVAPLFASILPTFVHCISFPGKPYPPSRTAFEFPRIPAYSSFFETTNSSLLFSLGCLSASLDGEYYRLYTSESDGLSFNRLQNALLGYSGPTLLLIRAVCPDANSIFGAFTASPWKESKDFYGNTDCFLFQMAPLTAVYRPSGNDRNFMYCNSCARSRGYDQQAHGIGFGGSVDQPRLFLAENFDDCVAAPNQDLTFDHGSLLPLLESGVAQKYFEVDSMEVWGVGGDEVVAQALGARSDARKLKADAIAKSRKVDRAQFLDDFRTGLIGSKMFKHRQEADGRADQDLEDLHHKKYSYEE